MTKKNTKQMYELHIDFINELRLCYSTYIFNFGNKENSIIPEKKTHGYLLRNFTINNAILDFYYSHTNRFFSNDEYEKMKNTGYVGQKEHTLKPYPFVICGAYFNRIDLTTKLQSIIYQDVKERPKLNGNSVEYFSDLIPYFKEYAEGFKDGYENFEQNCINEYLPSFPDKNDYINKVFEYLTKRIIFEHDWYNNHSGFTISIKSGKDIGKGGEIVNAFEDGQKQGFFYRAWSIVFSNNNLFAPLFEQQQTKETSEPQQPETVKPDEVKKELYNHIFKGNAFEVWQSMFDSFQITESSRTDVKFMFEEMKKDGLIHNTVNQKTFLDWLSEPPYQITIQKTSNYSKTKERISIYSNAKQLYKS